MKKRILSLTLLLSMLTSLAACGGSSSQDTTSGSDTTLGSDTTPPEQEVVYSLDQYIPKQDLGGFTYTILAFNEYTIQGIYADEETGSLINDAVVNKIRTVEEHLNCDIVLSEMSVTEETDGNVETRTSIMSGEHEFDLVLAHDLSLADMSLEGMFVNIMELDAFDLEAEWWPQKTIDSMRVGDALYLMTNNVTYYPVSDTRALFFNKEMAADYQFGSLYDMVYDGTWTFDKMNEMVASVYKDLNGNQKKDMEDQYGLVNFPHYYGWLEALNVGFYKSDDKGVITYDFDMDRTTNVVETIYDLIFTSGGTFITETEQEYAKMFADELSLFTYTRMRDAVQVFSFSDVPYGVLPMPKLDENQEDYYGGCTDRPSAIPVTVPAENLENVALITEAMNIEGYYSVFPVYYEMALKTRYSDETDDAEMIDIIYNNRILSFSYLYGSFGSPALMLLETLFVPNNPSTDVTSYAASIADMQEYRVSVLNKFFSNN